MTLHGGDTGVPTRSSAILAAGAVVQDDDDRFLLVLRATKPEAGRWSVPGGRVEAGESLRAAAAREVLEETGIVVEVLRKAWSVRMDDGDGGTYEIHDFVARPVGGALAAGDDAADAGWFSATELARLPLTADLAGFLDRAGLLPQGSRETAGDRP